jgi:FMN phosphatase YigB (HAD superfamily)
MAAARKIQQSGLKVGVLTNNYYCSHAKKRTAVVPEIYEFDVVVESCKVALRKPDPKIFQANWWFHSQLTVVLDNARPARLDR